MKHLISRLIAFAVIFMIGTGNFAYATSAVSCRTMGVISPSRELSQKKAQPCCERSAMPCRCEIKADSKLFPQLAASLQTSGLFLSILGFTAINNFMLNDSPIRRGFSSKSPPGQNPLFVLYSVYRI